MSQEEHSHVFWLPFEMYRVLPYLFFGTSACELFDSWKVEGLYVASHVESHLVTDGVSSKIYHFLFMTVYLFILFFWWKEDCTVSECCVAVMFLMLISCVHFTEPGIVTNMYGYTTGNKYYLLLCRCSITVCKVWRLLHCNKLMAEQNLIS